MLEQRRIAVEPDFLVERVDDNTLVSYDEREVPFDLLVTVPLNMGAEYVARSGLGDELNYVPVDKAHPAVPGARQHLRPGRRQQRPGVQGGFGGALRDRVLRGQLRGPRRGAADDGELRRARQLLRGVR
jgi:hypothetical protein